MLGRTQVRRDTAANWSSTNPTMLSGELGFDSTNRVWKLGDGSTAWNSLAGFRIPKLLSSQASATSWTINADVTDVAIQTAVAGALTINAPTGSFLYDGQPLTLRIKDNATARAITWNAIWRFEFGYTAPTTTVISKWMWVQAAYNSTDTKWDVLALGKQT